MLLNNPREKIPILLYKGRRLLKYWVFNLILMEDINSIFMRKVLTCNMHRDARPPQHRPSDSLVPALHTSGARSVHSFTEPGPARGPRRPAWWSRWPAETGLLWSGQQSQQRTFHPSQTGPTSQGFPSTCPQHPGQASTHQTSPGICTCLGSAKSKDLS